MERYFEQRRQFQYYQKVIELAKRYCPSAESVIDIGAKDARFVQWLDWIPSKTALDRNPMAEVEGVTNCQVDFCEFHPERKYDLALCLQVLEHLGNPELFAQKLLTIGKTLIVSVPYKWPDGLSKWHCQDPVDEFKLYRWVDRHPVEIAVVKDQGLERLISVYRLS